MGTDSSQIVSRVDFLFGLNPFPLPPLLFFGIMQFDFLHPINELNQRALVLAHLVEPFVVQFFPFLQKKRNPRHIEYREHKVNTKYGKIEKRQDNTKNDEIYHRKHCH